MFLKKYGNLTVGVVFVALAVITYIMSTQLPPNLLGGMGPEFMPQVLAGFMGILGVIQCVMGVKSMKEYTPSQEEEKTEFKPEYMRVLATVVAFGIYVFTIKIVGFLVCSVIYLFVQMCILAPKEKRNYLLFAVIAVLFNVVVYFIFRNGLNVMLPTGFLR